MSEDSNGYTQPRNGGVKRNQYRLEVRKGGASGYVEPEKRKLTRFRDKSERGSSRGWSYASTRRVRTIFQSIDVDSLEHSGLYAYAVTLTMGQCPNSHETLICVVQRYLRKLKRQGLIHYLWIMEFQKGLPPHLHLAVWLEQPDSFRKSILASTWIRSALIFKPDPMDQEIKEIYDLKGWLEYLGEKRLDHYQRRGDAVPVHWTTTGRLWSRSQNLPTVEPVTMELNKRQFFALRRISVGRKHRKSNNRNSSVRGFNLSFREPDKILAYLRTMGIRYVERSYLKVRLEILRSEYFDH